MLARFSIRTRVLGTTILAGMLLVPPHMLAADHVVSPADLSQAARSAASGREHNIARLRGFLATDEGRQALSEARIDPARANAALAQLSDQELARLTAKADQAEKDFAAGRLTTGQTTLIIVAAIAVVLIIVIAIAA